jgi:hypothetical protein
MSLFRFIKDVISEARALERGMTRKFPELRH